MSGKTGIEVQTFVWAIQEYQNILNHGDREEGVNIMDKHEKRLYLAIKEVIQDSKHKSPLQIDGQILLILDMVEELVLSRKNDALLEAAKIIKSEYENQASFHTPIWLIR